jgi:hypothetical protein
VAAAQWSPRRHRPLQEGVLDFPSPTGDSSTRLFGGQPRTLAQGAATSPEQFRIREPRKAPRCPLLVDGSPRLVARSLVTSPRGTRLLYDQRCDKCAARRDEPEQRSPHPQRRHRRQGESRVARIRRTTPRRRDGGRGKARSIARRPQLSIGRSRSHPQGRRGRRPTSQPASQPTSYCPLSVEVGRLYGESEDVGECHAGGGEH